MQNKVYISIELFEDIPVTMETINHVLEQINENYKEGQIVQDGSRGWWSLNEQAT